MLPDDEANLDAAGLARSKDTQLLKAIEVLTGKAVANLHP
jgi:hypothetical protein